VLNKQTLYALVDELEREIQRSVDPETGELSEDAFGRIDKLEMSVKDKALNVGAYASGLVGEAERTEAIGKAIKAQAEKHMERGKRLRKQADEWVGYIDRHLERAGIKPAPRQDMLEELGDERVELVYSKSMGVDVLDKAKLPKRFLRKVEQPPDLKKIMEYCKENDGVLKIGLVTVAKIDYRQTLKVK